MNTLGSVRYLNARPLVSWFTRTEEGRATGTSVVEGTPAALAPRIESGELDAGLVSSIALIRRPALAACPGIAIASDGPVRSVRLLSRVPLKAIRRVALDTSSLTSVVLTRILLAERYSLTPDYFCAAPDIDAMLTEADAALLIGDPGYREYDPALRVMDLGEEWRDWTGLPFVYALWIGRPERLTEPLVAQLHAAKAWGLAHRDELADALAERYGQTPERARDYFFEAIRYDLGEREEAGLRLFGQMAREHGLA